MALLEVYSKCIRTKYKSKFISQSTFIVVLFGVFSVIVPFIFAYKSGGLWLKHDIFYEQPDIKFKGEYLFVATTNKPDQPITCSTYGYYQQVAKNFDRCSMIQVQEVDSNYDRIVDELKFDLSIVLPKGVTISSFNIILPIEYKLHHSCPLELQSAIIFQYNFVGVVSEFSVFSYLKITQTSPLICHRKLNNNFYNDSIIEDEDDIESYKFENIIGSYMKRNLSTHLSNVYTQALFGDSEDFKVSFHVRYPEDRFYYQPGFWQIMKHAWLQYYAIYILVIWVTKTIKDYIFTNRLVLFYIECPIKKNSY